jgi:hypothetical protein
MLASLTGPPTMSDTTDDREEMTVASLVPYADRAPSPEGTPS